MSKILASSVIRGTKMGESHVGVYIVDLEIHDFERIMDWNDNNINWAGRGGERGLKSIHGDQIIMAASNEVFVYDKDICLFDIERGERLKAIYFSMDTRNTIHGLEIWPF